MLLRHIEHNRVLHETVVLLTFLADRRPRVPFHERHSVHRLGHGFYRIQVRLGFMQTPDIPLSLINCNRLGFDADLDHKNYYIAHETIVRRDDGIGDGSGILCDFLVSQPDRQPRAGFLQDSAGRHHRGGISGRNLTLAPAARLRHAACIDSRLDILFRRIAHHQGGRMTITATAPLAGVERSKLNSIVFASCLGTIIEWYDFLIYATAAALVFNKAFFPTFDPLAGTLAALGSYAVGFLARPLGGALFGHFGDRLGRKSMLVLTLFIMGISTFCIGLLPTYASIGVLAPILLIVLRIIQGIGLGGEWGGASLMVLEHAPADKRGFYTSFVQIGFPIGLVLATLVFTLVSQIARCRFRCLRLAHSVPDQHRAARDRHLRAIPGAGDAGVRRAQAAQRSVRTIRSARPSARTPRHS